MIIPHLLSEHTTDHGFSSVYPSSCDMANPDQVDTQARFGVFTLPYYSDGRHYFGLTFGNRMAWKDRLGLGTLPPDYGCRDRVDSNCSKRLPYALRRSCKGEA